KPDDSKTGIGLNPRHGVGGNVLHEIDPAGEKLVHQGRLVGKDSEDHRVETGERSSEIPWVPHQLDDGSPLVAFEQKGTAGGRDVQESLLGPLGQRYLLVGPRRKDV